MLNEIHGLMIELRELQKAKRSAYHRFVWKQNAEGKTSYSKIKNHYERVIKTKTLAL